MIIYLDLILINNIVMNATILYLSLNFNKIRLSHFEVILSALLGGIISIISMLYLKTPLQNIVKIIVPAIMCKICSPHLSTKSYIKFLSTYFMFSFILSGVMLWLKYNSATSKHFYITSIACATSIIFFIIIFKTTVYHFSKYAKKRHNYHEIAIYHQGVKLKLIGFNDTGNTLVSDKELLPVFICDYESLSPILKSTQITFNTIECQTILSSSYIDIFKPDFIYIDDKIIDAFIGVTQISLNTDYDILLNLNTTNYNETEINYA